MWTIFDFKIRLYHGTAALSVFRRFFGVTKGGFAMKKTHGLRWVFWVAALLPLVLGGCGGGGDETAKGDRISTDRLVAMLGDMPDLDFMPALESRLTNKTEGEITGDTEVVILHDRYIDALSDAQKAGLKRVYESGGIVVLIEPTYDELREAAGIVGHELAAAEDEGPEHFCDLYAFNGDWHTYVMGHTHGDHAASLDCTSEGAHYEALMDDLIAWVDQGGPEEKTALSNRGDVASVDITTLVKRQTVTHILTVNHSMMSRHPTVKNIYGVYALYDFDHDFDYYFVDRETNINSDLAYISDKWEDAKYKHHFYFGYWLYSYDTNAQLEGAIQAGQYRAIGLDGCTILQPVPETDIGSQGYTFSQGYSVSGTVGFSGLSGSGSISGGASYSVSHTMDVADLQTYLRAGEDFAGQFTGVGNAAWRYQVQNLPKFHRPLPSYTYPSHGYLASAPPAIARTTAVFYNNWIWRVPNPKAYEGSFQVTSTYNPLYTLNHIYRDWPNIEVEENIFHCGSSATASFLLKPPPRERPKSDEE